MARANLKAQMKIKVTYFAVFREKAGLQSEEIDFHGISCSDLFNQLSIVHAFLEKQSGCKVAVNDNLVDWDFKLSDGDDILLFPPVAGG